MPRLFSTTEAARLAGVVASSARNHTRDPRFTDYFSEQAQPTGDKPRQFAANDIKVLSYIGEQTRSGVPLDAIAEDLKEKLDGYDWTLEEAQRQADSRPRKARSSPKTGPGAQQQQEATTTALAILGEFTRAMQAEFSAAREREAELQQQVIEAEQRAARAEAQLMQDLIAAERRAATAEAEAAAARSQLAAMQEQRSRSLWARLFRR